MRCIAGAMQRSGVIGFALLLGGCGGQSRSDGSSAGGAAGQTGSSDGGPTQDSAVASDCKSAADLLCDESGKCSAHQLKVVFGDATQCRSDLELLCGNLTQAPGGPLAASDVAGCLSSYACSSLLAYDPTLPLPAACALGPRTLKAGSPCVFPGQCQSERCLGSDPYHRQCGYCVEQVGVGESCLGGEFRECDPTQARCDGSTCVPWVKLGQSCSISLASGDPCEPGTYCDTAKCVAKIGAGSPCQPFPESCTAPLVCSSSNTCAPADPPLGAGATCDSSSVCDVDQGLACDYAQNKCIEKPIAQPSESCTQIGWVPFDCAASGFCVNGTTCLAAPGEGEGCGYVSGLYPACKPPYVCASNTCKLFTPALCGAG